jgi:23S rRNA-/tRNA-specific pseudouridylate synthase
MGRGDALQIIDAGPGWIAVDKPMNVSVHNEPGRDLVSRLSRMLEADLPRACALGYTPDSGVYPIHRLDRETSGVMLLALNPEIARLFARQFEERNVSKHYRALVHGVFPESGSQETVWRWPLSPSAGGRKDPVGTGKKVPCATRIRVLDQSSHYALIECELLTGRKHQIRRHAKLAGHPLVGDTRYNSKRAVDFVKTQCGFFRLGLHAVSLAIVLPGGKEKSVLNSPLPEDFRRMIEQDKLD